MFSMSLMRRASRGIVFLLLICAQSAVAADLPLEKLKSELSVYQKNHSISGQFLQTKFIKELSLKLKSEGHFNVIQQKNKPDFIFWQILKPEEINICITGATLFIQTKNANKSETIEQNLSDIEANDPTGMAKLHSLMIVDSEVLFKKFNITKIKNTLTLKTKNQKDNINKIELTLNNNKLIEEVQVFDQNGDILKIQFIKLKKDNAVLKEKKCNELLKK